MLVDHFYIGGDSTLVDATIIEALSSTKNKKNERDLNQMKHLLHGDEEFVSGDADYQGAEKREELQDTDVEWLIAERTGKVRALRKHPRKNKTAIKIEYLKARMLQNFHA